MASRRIDDSRDRFGRRGLAVAGAAALAAGAALWLLARDPRPADRGRVVTAAATPDELVWRVGDHLAYLLAIDSEVALDPAQPGQRIEHALRARLCANVLGRQGSAVEVAMQLRDVDYRVATAPDAARARALGVPFVVGFVGGMPTSFRFPAGLDGEVQVQLSEVVRTFQASLPAVASTTWTAVEEHQSGRFRAVYDVRHDGAWHKRKAAYLHGARVMQAGEAQGEASVRVLHSDATLALAREASWWGRAEVADELELSNQGQLVARVATRSTLTAAAAAWDPDSDVAGTPHARSLLQRPVPALDPPQTELPAVEAKPATAADRRAFSDLAAQFTASRGDDLGYVHRLAAMLRTFPELASEIPPLLRDRDVLATVAAGLAHALELAGGDVCQGTLAEVAGDSSFAMGHRLRAIVALGGVSAPTDLSVEFVSHLAESGSASPDAAASDLANTALLALGQMGKTLHEHDAARYADVAATLARVAEAGPAPDARAVALQAIANSRDPGLLPVASRALTDGAAAVRAAAAQALAAMDQPAGLELLSARLGGESDGRVRAAMVAGMRAMHAHTDAGLTLCARLVETERDPAARGEMARYLVDHLASQPDARPVLERVVRAETDPKTLAYVAGRLYRARDERP
ncbi:MAG: HEAT repeat domain-containing protein [Planctomycetota bacterium]